jgi:AraC-like DNA-binding protein
MVPTTVVDEYAQARPAPALRRFAAFYTGYRQRGLAPARHRGLPSPYLTLIFTLDEPLVVAAHPDPAQPPGEFGALLGGLHMTPALICHDGAQSGVQVAISPAGCRALFGLPAAELANLDVDAAAVLGDQRTAEVRERLAAAPDWPARFAALDTMLLALLPDSCASSDPIWYAYRRLLRDGVPIAALADEVGWTGRHLTFQFRAELGLGPKQASRVARFDRARRSIRPGRLLAEVAADHGYADQSHLVREFQALAGCSPSRWLADEFGFVQAQPVFDDHDGTHDDFRMADSAGE